MRAPNSTWGHGVPAFSHVPCPPCRPPARWTTPWPPATWSSNSSLRTSPSPPLLWVPRLASGVPSARRPGVRWPWPRSSHPPDPPCCLCRSSSAERPSAPLPEETGAGRPSRPWASLSRWQGGFLHTAARPQSRRKAAGRRAQHPQTARDP